MHRNIVVSTGQEEERTGERTMTLWEWLRQRYLRRKHIIDAIEELENKVNPYKKVDLIVYDDITEVEQ